MTWQPPRESRNTAPTEKCPHPEWWSAWNPVSTEVEVSMLIAALVKAVQPEHVLEIGAHYGQTTERIARVIIENGHGEITSLDINPEMIGSASHRCQGLPVTFVCMNSTQYIPEHPIDFLFVDGSEQRAADFEHYLPYLSISAMVVVHDTAAYLGERQRILDLWMGNHIELNTPRGVLIMTR